MKTNSSMDAHLSASPMTGENSMLGKAPLVPPSLALWWAMDYCAAQLWGVKKAACYTKSPFFLEHIPMRLPSFPVNPDEGVYSAALWAAPGRRDWQKELENITRRLAPEGLLLGLAVGPLARWLPEGLAGAISLDGHLAPWQLRRYLSLKGYHIQGWLGFNTPVSMFWGRMSLILEGLGLPYLGDRARAQMLDNFVGTGPLALLSPLSLFWATSPAT